MPDRPTTDKHPNEEAKKPWRTPKVRDLGLVAEVTATSQQLAGGDTVNNYTT
jgi:hypothetical protein